MKLIVRKEAEREIHRAYTWYEHQRPGLGEHFLSELEHGFARIQQHPKMYGAAYKAIRKAPLRTFQYSIYYLTDNRGLIVLRVLHHRQQQPGW